MYFVNIKTKKKCLKSTFIYSPKISSNISSIICINGCLTTSSFERNSTHPKPLTSLNRSNTIPNDDSFLFLISLF